MVTIIIAITAFSILILIHELGHFIVAKKVGIRVETFSMGMGKRLWGIKVGDTNNIQSSACAFYISG